MRHPVKSILFRITLFTLLCVGALAFMPGNALADDGDTGDFAPDECAACHEDAYQSWQGSIHALASTDPLFIDAWSRSNKPNYCYSCHGTGYDPVAGTVAYEGVACVMCHQENTSGEGPHMTIDESAESCGTCHTGTHAPDYDEWLMSDHAVVNVGCNDCHQSHTAELRLETSDELCSSCHPVEASETAHSQEGMACHDCHMHAPDNALVDPLSGRASGAGHSFNIPAGVCSSCHGMAHNISASPMTTGSNDMGGTTLVSADELDCEPEGPNDAVTNLNLGLMGGSVGGLLLGIAIPTLLRRRNDNE